MGILEKFWVTMHERLLAKCYFTTKFIDKQIFESQTEWN